MSTYRLFDLLPWSEFEFEVARLLRNLPGLEALLGKLRLYLQSQTSFTGTTETILGEQTSMLSFVERFSPAFPTT